MKQFLELFCLTVYVSFDCNNFSGKYYFNSKDDCEKKWQQIKDQYDNVIEHSIEKISNKNLKDIILEVKYE